MKHVRFGLLPRILLAIVMGIGLGLCLSEPWIRPFVTLNGIFAQLLGFLIPLIIIGLVLPAIADIGHTALKLLLTTVAIAYLDTVLCGLMAYGTGNWLFPSIVSEVAQSATAVSQEAVTIKPFFEINIPPMFDVMSALVFSFMMGLCIAYGKLTTLHTISKEFMAVVTQTISKLVIPLLPIYIFGIFLEMTFTGQVWHIVSVFAQVIIVIFILHIVILLYQFCVAGLITRRNPIRLLWNMLPAYMTALGTSSSAATIPVTLQQTKKNGVNERVAGFCIPLCATIHMSGSAMKITSCALTICLLQGLPYDFGTFLHFILMLGIVMVAAPGVPGGAIMAALAPLSAILGFDAAQQALIVALYIAMDSFGTACNVTGDGAIALIIDRINGEQPD